MYTDTHSEAFQLLLYMYVCTSMLSLFWMAINITVLGNEAELDNLPKIKNGKWVV